MSQADLTKTLPREKEDVAVWIKVVVNVQSVRRRGVLP